MVTVFTSSGFEGEMEANNIQKLLESNGVTSVVVGSTIIPSLEYQVQAPSAQAEEAKRLIEEAQAGGPEAADEAEAASESGK
jgi:hypothetical protein